MRVSVALSDILPTNTVVATFIVDVDIGTWTCGWGNYQWGWWRSRWCLTGANWLVEELCSGPLSGVGI